MCAHARQEGIEEKPVQEMMTSFNAQRGLHR